MLDMNSSVCKKSMHRYLNVLHGAFFALHVKTFFLVTVERASNIDAPT